MKTLIINSSPRKNGDTIFLINNLCKLLKGDQVIINTYYDNISPCIDCRYCYKNKICKINDNMQYIYNCIETFDNIIVATPLYYSQPTGSFLNFASRLQLYYVNKFINKSMKNIKEKKGGIILTCGGDTKNTQEAEKTIRIILNQINTKIISTVYSVNTNILRSNQDEQAIKQIYSMAEKFNNLTI